MKVHVSASSLIVLSAAGVWCVSRPSQRRSARLGDPVGAPHGILVDFWTLEGGQNGFRKRVEERGRQGDGFRGQAERPLGCPARRHWPDLPNWLVSLADDHPLARCGGVQQLR